MRNYFVSYFYTQGSQTGFGNIQIQRDALIIGWSDVERVQKLIKDTKGHDAVVIISFQPFEGPVNVPM